MTNYFEFCELVSSDTAKTMGIDNLPTWDQIASIRALVTDILNPLREAVGMPIYINSCFRTQKLNEAVGGARNSQHVATKIYAAADLDTKSKSGNKKIYELLRRFTVDQVIWEKDGEWVHVSYRTDGKNRNQYM